MTTDAKRNAPPVVDLDISNYPSIFSKGFDVRNACRDLAEKMQNAANFGMELIVTLNDGEPVIVDKMTIETTLRVSYHEVDARP